MTVVSIWGISAFVLVVSKRSCYVKSFQLEMAKAVTPDVYDWQLAKTSVGDRVKHLYKNPLMADVNFVVSVAAAGNSGGDHPKITLPSHKFVLAISSPVFYAMFYGQMPETSDFIDLPDCDSEGFLEFLRYIYCDEVKLTGSCVMQVLYLAKKYMVPLLTAKCRVFLEANINTGNVLGVLPQVYKMDEVHLTDVCWKIVDLNTEEILRDAPSSLLEDRDVAAALLKRDSLNVSEIKLFQAVNCWAEDICKMQGMEGNGKEKRSVVGDSILRLVRFPLMSQKEFAMNVPDTEILTDSEIVQLFMYFNLGRKPAEFSSIPRVEKSRHFRRCKRFSGAGYFWNYNRGKADVISFTVDTPVLLRGVRLFGFKGEKYSVKLKICGESAVEDQFQTEDREVDGYYGFDIIFDQNFEISPGVPCVLEALIRGPKSFCGVSGKEEVPCEKVIFHFTATDETQITNGSSVNQGQFAEVLFTLI